jgi:hypothetical protein
MEEALFAFDAALAIVPEYGWAQAQKCRCCMG